MSFRRGIPAEPILNGYCGDYDVGMETPDVDMTTHSPQESLAAEQNKAVSAYIYIVIVHSVLYMYM